MNEAISNKIEQIRNKFSEFKVAIALEKSDQEKVLIEKDRLENKILDLEQKLIQSNSDLISSNEELQRVKNELANLKNLQQEQSVELSQISNHKSDLEIDFIVREIDQCISQIKASI
jgi:hypothetical protein